MAQRNDIHRPSAIQPQDYEFVALTNRRGVDYAYLDHVGIVLQERARLTAHMNRTGGTWSAHEHGGNCFSCGAHCIYMAAFYHAKSNSYIRTGMDCAEKLNMGDPARFRKFKDAVDAARHHKTGLKKAEGILDQRGISAAWKIFHFYRNLPSMEKGFLDLIADDMNSPEPKLIYADWLDENGMGDRAKALRKAVQDGTLWKADNLMAAPKEESIVCDIVSKLAKWGNLTERQFSYLHKLLADIESRPDREAKKDALDAKRAQEKAQALDVPTGKFTLTVEVLKIDQKEYHDGYRLTIRPVMTCKAIPEGYCLWGTIPSDCVQHPSGRDLARGDTLELSATLTPSDKDPKFGFFKFPRGRFVQAAPKPLPF